jgi:hypothetical protein
VRERQKSGFTGEFVKGSAVDRVMIRSTACTLMTDMRAGSAMLGPLAATDETWERRLAICCLGDFQQ